MFAATLLANSAFAARDPFTPPEDLLCEPAASAPPPRLRGIIGHETDYRAWLITPSGGRLWMPQSWPDPDWRLQEITALGITLVPAAPCSSPLRITLQGSPYETRASVKNTPSANAGADGASESQPAAALSGVR